AEVASGKKCDHFMPRFLYDQDELVAVTDAYYASLLAYADGNGEAPTRIDLKTKTLWWWRNILGRRLLSLLATDDAPYVAQFVRGESEALAVTKMLHDQVAQLDSCL